VKPTTLNRSAKAPTIQPSRQSTIFPVSCLAIDEHLLAVPKRYSQKAGEHFCDLGRASVCGVSRLAAQGRIGSDFLLRSDDSRVSQQKCSPVHSSLQTPIGKLYAALAFRSIFLVVGVILIDWTQTNIAKTGGMYAVAQTTTPGIFFTRLVRWLFLWVGGLIAYVDSCPADNLYWNASSDDWFNASNWNDTTNGTNRIPTGNDYVIIQNGGEPLVSSNAVGNFFQINYGSALSLSGGGALTFSASEIIGYYGTGSLTQSGGTNASVYIDLGVAAGSAGTYNLSGGTLNMSGTSGNALAEAVGFGSNGTFIQTGGNNNTPSLDVGHGTGSSGQYTLSGGLLNVNTNAVASYSSEGIGASGNGTFLQTGGTHNTVTLYIGYGSAATGAYSLSDSGTLNVSANEYIGYFGSGTFTQTGGTHTVTGALAIAPNPQYNTKGTYSLQGGSLSAASITLYVGGSLTVQGTTSATTLSTSQISNYGTITQTGGTSIITGSLNIGDNFGSTGTYGLQGGNLTASTINVGGSGSFSVEGSTLSTNQITNAGIFTQTGGTTTVNGGTFSQTSGGLLNVRIGGTGNGQFGQIVAGTAVLSGVLNVTFVNGYQPGKNDSFQVLSTNSLTGTFNNGNPLIKVGTRYYSVTYANSGVTIKPTSVLTFYHESDVEHTFLSLSSIGGETTIYRGFHPVANPISSKGFVGDESQTPWDFGISYPITEDAYYQADIAIFFDETEPNTPDYSLLQFNCTNWIAKIAQVAHIQLPPYTDPAFVADPSYFALALVIRGAGTLYQGGVVISNGFVFPPMANGAATAGTPYDYSYSNLESAGFANASTLATSIGFHYDPINLGTVNANNVTGLSLKLVGTMASNALISINWGDGSSYTEQSLTPSHVYAAGTYNAQLLIIDSGALHAYSMTVAVSQSPSTPVTVNITAFPPVSNPNPGLVPADPVPDFIVMQTTNLSILPNGHGLIQFNGIPGWTYSIQATSSLNQSFSTIGTATADTNGNFQYDDPAAVGATHRFYRATYP